MKNYIFYFNNYFDKCSVQQQQGRRGCNNNLNVEKTKQKKQQTSEIVNIL